MRTSDVSGGPRRGRGFTLIELLVVVAVIALLVSILLPSLAQARELAKRAKCLVTINSTGKALWLYMTENNSLPPTITYREGNRWRSGMVFPKNRDDYNNRYYEGILVSRGYLSAGISECPNPRGYIGGSRSGMVHNPPRITPPYPPSDNWYGWRDEDEDIDGPKYDYSINYAMLGPRPDFENGGDFSRPNSDNAINASRTVMLAEWNFPRGDVLDSWFNQSWSEAQRLQWGNYRYGPAGMPVATGKPDWNRRHTRHAGGSYGANNFAFVDGHAEPIEAKMDHVYWWAGYKDAQFGVPSSMRPEDVYPQIRFYGECFGWNEPDSADNAYWN